MSQEPRTSPTSDRTFGCQPALTIHVRGAAAAHRNRRPDRELPDRSACGVCDAGRSHAGRPGSIPAAGAGRRPVRAAARTPSDMEFAPSAQLAVQHLTDPGYHPLQRRRGSFANSAGPNNRCRSASVTDNATRFFPTSTATTGPSSQFSGHIRHPTVPTVQVNVAEGSRQHALPLSLT